MTSRTAWVAGNGVGLTWTAMFASGDLTSMASGNGVVSSNSDIANGTNLDQFCDIAVGMTVTSNTYVAGSNIAVYIFQLSNTNGSTVYGDGQMATPGTSAAFVAGGIYPVGIIPIRAATLTLLAGMIQGVVLPPGSFRFALVNNSGFALSSTAANNVAQYRTYNQNLNA